MRQRYEMLVTFIDHKGEWKEARRIESAESEHLARRKVMENMLASGVQVKSIKVGLEPDLV